MSYHIYHTRGLILWSMPTGESNRFYKIFTEELGLVGASAQSVREGKSKLRYVLQDFSWVTLDLVRGKEVWRITSAGEGGTLSTTKDDNTSLKFLARACSLVLRLVHGEGREDNLFHDLTLMTEFLENNLVDEKLELAFEALTALRILAHLGYLDPTKYENFLYPIHWSTNILEEFEKIRISTLPSINEALHESQL